MDLLSGIPTHVLTEVFAPDTACQAHETPGSPEIALVSFVI
jgi:hypothetical protein